MGALTRYTKGIVEENREQVKVKRDSEMISMGTSVFVHSIKNQLLSSRVLYRKATALIDSPEESDLASILHQLVEQNNQMLKRIDELHQSVKSESVLLQPIFIQEVVKEAHRKYNEKYAEEKIEIVLRENPLILADLNHLSEAIYNLLINAQEAVDAAKFETEEPAIRLICRGSRQYCIVEIEDFGIGMREDERKNALQAFYSSKNSNLNWGMGLHYVQSIVKEHFGLLRLTSEYRKGTKVTFLLPKAKKDE